MSVVMPGGPVSEQAPDGGRLPTSAAASAPVQRTSFSISLDINTSTVSIQGSVTSPNQADRTTKCTPASSISPESAACSPPQLMTAEQQGALEEGDTHDGEDMGPMRTADLEEGWEPLVEDDCSPEEVVGSGGEAKTAEECKDAKQKYVSDEAFETLGDQGAATDCVAENEMDSTYTTQPAPEVETNFEERDAVHITQAAGNKSSSFTEGNFTMSASDKQMAVSSNELDSVETASEGTEALIEGHGQQSEGNDAIDKAIDDAIAEVQQVVADDDS